MTDRIQGGIWPEDLHRQADGRYMLIFREKDKIYKQENISLCGSGSYIHDSGNDSGTRYYSIHFEVIVDFHPPKEEL